MAGDMVEMSPTAMMMIHNPSMLLYGEAAELEQGIDFLNEVKESIMNAYQLKTGLSRSKLSHLMDAETWFNAHAAHDLGFCDKVMYTDDSEKDGDEDMVFDKTVMVTNTIAAMQKKLKPIKKPEEYTEDDEKIEVSEEYGCPYFSKKNFSNIFAKGVDNTANAVYNISIIRHLP